ncbi:hypothetical protein DFH08DRAFT_853692 [Mycena albidolilacea]|uniref:Uncharacterized protein n=1 Tax=Mycena albidolilacea TaxID=1033008 RepID=A0AAD7EYF0_9AGAR|nr:hypothetical protein DFH08DRAFT_853692 [Mycena albidolilacea]
MKARTFTASATKVNSSSPGIKQRRKEWNESLPGPWVKPPDFRHPSNTSTITKTNPKKKYKLNEREIETLPYEHSERPSEKTGNATVMILYSEPQVKDLGLRKAAKLGVPLDLDGARPAWREHMLNSQPPPFTEITEYACPPDAVKPDPTPITWIPSKLSGSVSVADACRLYCIEPRDTQDLAAHSSWIDLATVAQRAVTLHGGFYAHEELVHERRQAEKQELSKLARLDERKSRFKFSPMIRQQWESEDDGTYDILPNRVAVFYSMKAERLTQYGAMWDFVPCT